MITSAKQKKYLRGLAHKLTPVVLIGQEGLHAGVFKAIDQALADHELIKVKLTDDRDERIAMSSLIEEQNKAVTAGLIGRIGIFYRPHADEKKRKIVLP